MRLGKPLNVSVPPPMPDIANVADELRNFSQRRKKPGTRPGAKTHPGLQLQAALFNRFFDRWHTHGQTPAYMRLGM